MFDTLIKWKFTIVNENMNVRFLYMYNLFKMIFYFLNVMIERFPTTF
jgi:hypothetical protein